MGGQVKTIRAISYEEDSANDVRSIADIREFEGAEPVRGVMSFTALSKDIQRRRLMMELMRDVDRLLTGEVDEIVLVAR